MTVRITSMTDAETTRVAPDDAGLGAVSTERGNLPLERIDVRADITGLTSRVQLTQDFVNVFDEPLEATYVFPLPDRAAVTGMRMTADGRVVEATLREREAARLEYDEAIDSGRRAAIAEEERPDVFTMRVGNILPGERVSIELALPTGISFCDCAMAPKTSPIRLSWCRIRAATREPSSSPCCRRRQAPRRAPATWYSCSTAREA